jgi:ABC-2 type transport system permease protein
VIALILSIITTLIMLFISVPVVLASNLRLSAFLAELQYFQSVVIMVYGMTAHALWFAPIFCWLLLVSAWARRAPLLWAVMPFFLAGILERLLFNTTAVQSMVAYRFTGGMKEAFVAEAADGNVQKLSQLDPLGFVVAPGLWTGLIFAALFLTAAIRLRQRHEPI